MADKKSYIELRPPIEPWDGDLEQSEPNELRLWIDPGNASPDVVANVLSALSDIHRAAGGGGLNFRIDGGQLVIDAEAHV